jgi:hypothetical protein
MVMSIMVMSKFLFHSAKVRQNRKQKDGFNIY